VGFQKGIINDEWYQKLVFFFLIVMAIGVPSSRILMSISQISLVALWLANGHLKQKWQAFIHNKAALLLVSLFLVHALGLVYSTDLAYALKDLKTKVPILIVPLIFVGFPKINSSQFEKLMYLFIGAVIFVSFYVSIKHIRTHEEIRHIISREFISHIRFSLSVNLALFYLIFLRSNPKNRGVLDIFSLLTFFWLLFFLFYLEAFTGVVVFIVLFFSVLSYMIFKSKTMWKRWLYLGIMVLGIGGVATFLTQFYMENTQKQDLDQSSLGKTTSNGGSYYHNLNSPTENGKYIEIYLCEPELKLAWEKRSILPYDGLDYKNQVLKFTLFRYMTSKDLKKDNEGLNQLTLQDIKNVENGIANVHYTQGIGIESRLMKILFEYENYIRTANPSGHSVMQRVEYWRTASFIIKKHFWFGVGTGDMNLAFQNQYEEMDSKLDKESRLRTHNQYLSIWVGLGLIGLLWFVFVLIYPPLKLHAFGNIYYFIFFVAFIVSMFTEDTIETQAGLTFYVFFNSLYLFLYNRPDDLIFQVKEYDKPETSLK